MPSNLLRINLPYACAGIIEENGEIIDAAPIFKWMIGKKLHEINDWIIKKGGKIDNC